MTCQKEITELTRNLPILFLNSRQFLLIETLPTMHLPQWITHWVVCIVAAMKMRLGNLANDESLPRVPEIDRLLQPC